jgi:hypothetical protein
MIFPDFAPAGLRRVAAVLLFSLTSLAVQASPVLWTLQDVEFEDGGTASGSFIYDRDSNAFSAISIITTTPAQAPWHTFNALLPGGFNDFNGVELVQSGFPNLSNRPLLQLTFMTQLTNAGGVVALVDFFAPPGPSVEANCLTSNCSSASFVRAMSSGGIFGQAVATVVPLPAAGLLLPAALGLLTFLRRRV